MCRCLVHVFYRIATILSSSPYWRRYKYLHHVLPHFPIDLHNQKSTIVLSFFFCGESADAVFLIANKSSIISISIGVKIFSFACTLSFFVCAVVLVPIGVDGVSLAIVVSRRIADFSICIGELVGRTCFVFSHLKFQI